MAAPSATARQTPAGIKMEDGHPTKITLANDPDISFWEMGVKPPGIDGGDKIATTTMFNTTWRTFAARQLKELTDGSIRVAYDPVVLGQIRQIINSETTITVTYYDGSTDAAYGYVKSFEPDELTEGEMPTASITLVFTNYDPTNRVEAGPTLVAVAGS